MRPLRAPAACALALLLTGCGSTSTPSAGTPPAAASSIPAPPAAVPAAPGPVTGQGTVIEVSDGGPELCLGPVRESYPPQCEGIPLSGWDWPTAGVQDESGTGGGRTRWGTYAVTGGFDGTTMTVTASVPLALYDVATAPSPRPVAPPVLDEEAWTAVERAVTGVPGVLTVVREPPTGPVHVTVVHDDGSVQGWAAAAFGPGAVLVTSALR